MKKLNGKTIARIVLSIATVVSLIISIQLANFEFSDAVVAFLITGFLLLATTIAFSPNPGKSENSVGKRMKRGTPVLVVGAFFGIISLFLILDSASGKYSGSGGMGGLVDLVYLAVVGPVAAIFLIVGLAMRLSDTDSK